MCSFSLRAAFLAWTEIIPALADLFCLFWELSLTCCHHIADDCSSTKMQWADTGKPLEQVEVFGRKMWIDGQSLSVLYPVELDFLG